MSRNVFGWDYPAGAEHDTRAPWNEPPECEACEGGGEIPAENGDDVTVCQTCDGTGRKRSDKESREDYEADMERDNV